MIAVTMMNAIRLMMILTIRRWITLRHFALAPTPIEPTLGFAVWNSTSHPVDVPIRIVNLLRNETMLHDINSTTKRPSYENGCRLNDSDDDANHLEVMPTN